MGKLSPHQIPRTSQAGSSLGSRVPIPRQGGPPPTAAPSIKWGAPCNATSPLALRRAEAGDTPRSPPRPSPPHLHRAAPCSSPGRPPRSTGEPPGSSPRGHSERPGQTRPRLRGAPRGADPARPKWAVQHGGGVPGASPPPGRGHAQAPRVTRVSRGARWRCTAGLRIPPSQAWWLYVWGVRSAQDSAAAAGHPLLQPGPRGQWRLVIVGAQRAWRRGGRPTPSVLLVEASLTDTLRLRSPEWEAEGQLPFTLARGPGPEPAPPAHVRG